MPTPTVHPNLCSHRPFLAEERSNLVYPPDQRNDAAQQAS
jgi:hypothetical protein